ncbi:hypothetical protein [Roseovarius albus]|nr:hypothetical protein [Roseovarius albus]
MKRDALAKTMPQRWLETTNATILHLKAPRFPKDITVNQDPEMPKAAWQLTLSEETSALRYGTGVERAGSSIFEGVWSASFAAFDFENADYVFGSGVTSKPEGCLVLTPPTHMLESIFVLYDAERNTLAASNSLAGVLACLPEDIREGFVAKTSDMIRAVNDAQTDAGLFGYDPKVLEYESVELHAVFAHNLVLFPGQSPRFSLRLNEQIYDRYEDYVGFLRQVLASVFENGADPARSTAVFDPASCISAGYDSPAVTVLAMGLGVNNAFTLDLTVHTVNDSGQEIARDLGVKCTSFVHPAGKVIDNLNMMYEGDLAETAQEFIGTAGFGDDILYAAFESVLPNKILLDGRFGDGIWAKDTMKAAGAPVNISFNKSITEFRLRVGFVLIPVPTIGAEFPESIARISRSKEMQDWSVGGHYDRPIPRRLVEQAGGQRGNFGQKKGAANPNPLNFDDLKLDALKAMVDRYL